MSAAEWTCITQGHKLLQLVGILPLGLVLLPHDGRKPYGGSHMKTSHCDHTAWHMHVVRVLYNDQATMQGYSLCCAQIIAVRLAWCPRGSCKLSEQL